jgi:hypothetical protein
MCHQDKLYSHVFTTSLLTQLAYLKHILSLNPLIESLSTVTVKSKAGSLNSAGTLKYTVV